MIRACKACRTLDETIRRLRKIYEWEYYSDANYEDLSFALQKIIIETKNIMPLMGALALGNPSNAFLYGGKESDPFYKLVVAGLISWIRLTNTDDIPGFIISARWRKSLT